MVELALCYLLKNNTGFVMSQSLEMIGRRAETRVSCQITPCQFVLFPFAATASCRRNRKNQAVTHPSQQPSYY
jgi:hypothetical protein